MNLKQRVYRAASALIVAAGIILTAPALAADTGGAHGKVDPKSPVFVKLEPLNLTVFDRGTARGRFSLDLRLDVVQKAATARIESLKPRLQDGYVSAINEYTSRAADRVPDLDYLVEQLQKVTDQVVGGPNIAKVLVHSAVRIL